MINHFPNVNTFSIHVFFIIVFDIMLRVSEGQSWATAIMGVLPMRKGAIALENISNDDDRQVEPSIDPELPKECGENRTEEILSEANNE